MKRAYVDTSCLVAVALGEPGHEKVEELLDTFDVLHSSILSEAELRARLSREGIASDGSALTCAFDWVAPRRPLHAQIGRVLLQGVRLKGADVFQLACALYAAQRYPDLAFLTLDSAQLEAARRLDLAA
jgi:predicted nucleic acid-binding protein